MYPWHKREKEFITKSHHEQVISTYANALRKKEYEIMRQEIHVIELKEELKKLQKYIESYLEETIK